MAGAAPPVSILLVNDREDDLAALEALLTPLGQPILRAKTAEEGLALADREDIAVAIVDIRMPATDGFAMIEQLRLNPAHEDLPVIFVSAYELMPEELDRVHDLGAADFVSLPASPKALRSKVGLFVRLHRQAMQLREHVRHIGQAAATELAEQEERFRLFVEAGSDYALVFLDPMGLVTEWPVSAERLLGYRPEQAIGQHFRFFFTPADRADLAPEKEIEGAIGSGNSREDVEHLRADGTTIPVLGRLVALRDRQSSAVRGFAKIMRDATQIRALRQSEAKFREVFETANEGIWILNADMLIETANRRIADMLGYDVREITGRKKHDFAYPEDTEYITRLFEERRAGKIQPAVEVRFRHRDGHPIWTLLSARPLFRDGNFAGALDMFTDISARKAAEAELIESRKRLRLAIEGAELGVFYHDGASQIITWNSRLKTLLGLAPDRRASTEVFLERVHPEDRKRIEAESARVLAQRNAPLEFGFEYRVVWPDGTLRWLRSTGLNEPDLDGNFHVAGTVQDMTTAKEFEEELRRQIAERTRELEEKTKQLESYCYTVAHDLRAPLRAINGYASYVIEAIAGTGQPQAVEYLERIRSSTKRLDALVNDLLAYSRIEQLAVPAEPVDLQRVTQTVLHELESEIQRKHADVVVVDKLPPVIGEPSIVEHVLLNLVSNALKFTEPGKPPRIEIFATDGHGRVRLHVRDRGIGIAKEYQQRIFKVFERLQSSRSYPGTGIGLAIVARGVERLGGGYGVESEPGRGSTFWIELKRADSHS